MQSLLAPSSLYLTPLLKKFYCRSQTLFEIGRSNLFSKKRGLFLLLVIATSSAYSQIPIREYISSIVKLDTSFHHQIRDSGFVSDWNRWIQEADMNNDGKLDLVLQPYMNNSRRDGIISIFYNQSIGTTSVFRNTTRNNFFTLGDPGQFTVGDVNGDNKIDLLLPTQNYHGSYPPPPYLYPGGGDHTPDKLFIQRDTGFQRIVFPDNFNTESGNLYSLGAVNKKILITNYFSPINIPPHTDRNLLYLYDFNSDSTSLIRRTTLYDSSQRFLSRIGSVRHIGEEDPLYNYFALEKFRTSGNGLDSVYIISFRKDDSLNVKNPRDTIAAIKYVSYFTYGYEYNYRPVNDWGIYITDLNHDGIKEVVTHEFSYYNGPSSIDTAPPHTRIQIYNKTGNVTYNWIDSAVVYDPQKVAHGNGISVVDINGDGLPDILPYTGWGWWGWSYQGNPLENERSRKRIFLNTGDSLKAFQIDFTGYNNNFINQEVGYGHYYPFPLDVGSTERSIIILKGYGIGSSSFLVPTSDSLSAIPAIKLDYSQFKFPCSNFPPTYNFSADTLICNLSDSALMRIDSVKGYTTRWYKSNVLVGSKHLFYARDTGLYKLVITNLGGCQAIRYVRVNFASAPQPNFSINSSSQCLTNNSFGFTNTSSIASGSLTQHAWSFGDGGTATTLNATRSYAAPGTYTVKLVSTSNEGCKDSTTQQVVVNPMPAAGYTINNNAQCLTGNNFGFTNTSSITTGSLTQHSWNFGDGGTATTLNATRSYTAPGTYTVKLVSTSNNGCKDSITQQVVVNPMPSTTFSINSAGQCLSGNSFTFTNNSVITTGSLTQHSWNFGDGGTATTLNATRSYTAPGTYTVKLVSTSNNGCKDSTTRSVTVHPMPLSIFSANTAIQCLTGNTFQFSNNSMISSGTLSSNWSFGNGATSTLQSPTHSYAAVGSYTVKLVSTSNNGCKDSTTRDMRVDPSPTATLSVGPYRSIHPGLLTTISATITPAGNYQYTWYRNNTAIPNETTTVVDSIGYRLWSGAYKMAVANTTPLLPCTYTTPEVVIGDSASARLFIYPSPNTGQFKVTYYSPANTRYQIVITDTKGAVLYRRQHEVTNRYQLIDINLTGASRGLYLLQVQDPSGVPLTSGKFVIH